MTRMCELLYEVDEADKVQALVERTLGVDRCPCLAGHGCPLFLGHAAPVWVARPPTFDCRGSTAAAAYGGIRLKRGPNFAAESSSAA